MRTILPTLFLLLILNVSYGQTVTLDISGGYNAPLAPQTEAVDRTEGHDTSFPYYYTTNARVRGVSYGQGGNLALNLNWYSKKDIGFGMKLNMLFGSAFSHATTVNALGYIENYNFRDHSFSAQFIPHLCFRHDYKVASPILEAGMILGITYVDHNYTIRASNQSQTIQTKVRDFGNVLLGFYTSVGVSFNVSKVVKINLAVTCNAASYTPTKWKRTSFTVDGKSYLSSLNVSSTQGEYVSSLDLKASQSPNQPSKDLKSSVAFSSVGFNVGICFRLSGKKEKKETKKDAPNTIHPF